MLDYHESGGCGLKGKGCFLASGTAPIMHKYTKSVGNFMQVLCRVSPPPPITRGVGRILTIQLHV